MKKLFILGALIVILVLIVFLHKNFQKGPNLGKSFIGVKAYLLAKDAASKRYKDCKLSRLYCTRCTKDGKPQDGKYWYVLMQCPSNSKQLEYKVDKNLNLSTWQEIDYKNQRIIDLSSKDISELNKVLSKIPKDFCTNKDVKYYMFSLRQKDNKIHWSISCVYADQDGNMQKESIKIY